MRSAIVVRTIFPGCGEPCIRAPSAARCAAGARTISSRVQGPIRDLFASAAPDTRHEPLAPGAWLLHGFALPVDRALVAAVHEITAVAPFRHLETPGGFRMSVGMTNCGSLGWVSDRAGYRYTGTDPASERPWPVMPASFRALAARAAAAGGFAAFEPDACLVNRYA